MHFAAHTKCVVGFSIPLRTRPDRWLSPTVLSAAALALMHVAHQAHAGLLLWNNASGGSAAVAGNWSPGQTPLSGDDLQFNLVANYAVTFNALVASSNSQTYKRGAVTMTASNPHVIGPGALRVGDANGDSATLTLASGSLTLIANASIGNNTGSGGALAVNHADANLTLVGRDVDLIVASNGAGTLDISAGGSVQIADQFIAGLNATSLSNVTVSGFADSVPFAGSTLLVNGTTQSRFGQSGDATVNIVNGGQAVFAGDLAVALGSASASDVVVQGSGFVFDATLDVAGDLLLGRNTTAGSAAGIAMLNVNADGRVLVGDTLFVAGDPEGGSAMLQMAVDGLIDVGSLNIGNGATIDLDGGELNIDGGALAYSNNAAPLMVAGVGHPVATLRNGATANLAPTTVAGRSLVVGGGAGATLGDFDVRSGSSLTISGFGDVILGDGSDDTGGMIINGSRSTMTLSDQSDLIVGLAGSGRFEAELDGAVVGDRLIIANNAGSDGLALFESPGTMASFTVGYVGGSPSTAGGDGELVINAQATFDANLLTIWPSGVMTVQQGGMADIANTITVRGDLELEDGADVTSDFLHVTSGGRLLGPASIPGDATLLARVRLEGGSTLELINGDLTVGDPAASDGFEAQMNSAIHVAGYTLTLHDLDQAVLYDVTINGGEIVAPIRLNLTDNASLEGTGTITTTELLLGSGDSAITATGPGGITFNGRLRNNSGFIDGTKFTFNGPDGGWTGAGAINAQVVFNSGTAVNALANMTMGDSSNVGVTFNAGSELHTHDHVVTLLDADGVALGSVTELDGGELVCAAQLVVNSSRLLRGDGVVNAPLLAVFGETHPGDVSDRGVVEPDVGRLDVLGGVTLGAGAVTYMHIADAPPTGQFDVITAGGDIALGGQLTLRMLNGFSPGVGDSYTIIDGATLSGAFTALDLERPGPGRNWKVVYDNVNARVRLVVNACVADVTNNGAVDVADLLSVITAWGACANPVSCPSDVNDDNQVNVADLLSVINGWGTCP